MVDFTNLSSKFTNDNRCSQDVKCRIALAKKAFEDKANILKSIIDISLRKAYVWSTALYGYESWILGPTDRNRLESFEMWCYRRMLKIRWVDMVTN